MSLPLEAAQQMRAMQPAKSAKPRNRRTYLILIACWIFLIAGGVWGTKAYSDHLQDRITGQLENQTNSQLQAVQADYSKQVTELRTSLEGDLAKLQTKVDALTELLAFAKDSANTKTDNSNQLYTQLDEVKKKLAELQQNLDALK